MTRQAPFKRPAAPKIRLVGEVIAWCTHATIRITSWPHVEHVACSSMPRDLASDMARNLRLKTCVFPILSYRTSGLAAGLSLSFRKPVNRLLRINLNPGELSKYTTRLGTAKLSCSDPRPLLLAIILRQDCKWVPYKKRRIQEIFQILLCCGHALKFGSVADESPR